MNLNTLLFGVYPYICLAVFLIGSWLRYDREPYTWRSESSQMLRRGHYFHIASNMFHIGILGIFFGHLVGLLTPVEVFHVIGLDAGAKQWLAIMAGGVAGIVCFIGLVMLILRRFNEPRIRATTASAACLPVGNAVAQAMRSSRPPGPATTAASPAA